MKNRKGFTITELIIVIAVIAILAAVLIPTFSGIIGKANDSAMDQEVRAALTTFLAEKNAQIPANTYFVYKNGNTTTYFKYENGKLNEYTGTLPTYDTNDEVYAKQAAADIIKNGDAVITIGTESGQAKGKVLTDLSANVEILVDNAD